MKDYFGYTGKVCVVTGAASGMAKATVELLVELGAEVYALDVKECTVPGIKKSVLCNLGSKESIDQAFATQVPKVIHKFFGIAGVSGYSTDFNTTMTINFIANKYITEAYLLDRVADGPVGAIVYISSQGGAGWQTPANQEEYMDLVKAKSWEEAIACLKAKESAAAAHNAYMLSKRALIYYTKWMASKLGARNLRVNVTGPGTTVSAMTPDFHALAGSYENSKIMWGAIRRESTSEEQANAVVFLNSDMAVMISGVVLYVDGASRSNIDIGITPDPIFIAGPMLKHADAAKK